MTASRRPRLSATAHAGGGWWQVAMPAARTAADRQSAIDRLQAEIKALTDVEQILGASAPKARSTSRRSSSPPTTKAAAAADSKSEAKPATPLIRLTASSPATDEPIRRRFAR